MNIFSQDNIVQVVLPFFSLIITFIALIVGLDVIWRVQKHLKIFMLSLTLTVLILVLSEAGLILGMDGNSYWRVAVECMDVLTGLLFVSAFLQMYKIIRVIESENISK